MDTATIKKGNIGWIIAGLVFAWLLFNSMGGPDICEQDGYVKDTAGWEACMDFHEERQLARMGG